MEENLDGNAGSAAVPSATAVAALQRYTGERQPGSRPERMGNGAGVRFYAGEFFFLQNVAWMLVEIALNGALRGGSVLWERKENSGS